MNIVQTIVLGIIEGITEFLPISSTGHMVVASSFMGIADDNFTKLFEVAIQLGAILSVIVLYWKRFFQTIGFYYKLVVAFIPAAIFGVLFSKQIDNFLGNATIVGFALLIGGIIFLFVDKWFDEKKAKISESPGYLSAFIIGIFQCLAMVPGVSRSAATIIGGMSQKLTRKAAAEFSFFLAVPTMFAATAKKLLDYYQSGFPLTSHQLGLLALGNVIAFLVALVAIKSFIAYLSNHGLKIFGYYRIIAGIVILILIYSNFHLSV